MRYWRYITFAVLFTELMVFGGGRSGSYALMAFVALTALAHLFLESNPKWIEAKREVQKNNPLSRPIFNGVAIFLSAVIVILPYAEGQINGLLVVLATAMVSLTGEK